MKLIAVLIGTAGELYCVAASAQVSRSGGGGAGAQLMQQYQQIASERTQLQADNAKLKKDLEDLKKQLEEAKKQLEFAKKEGSMRGAAALAAARTQNEIGEKNLADSKARMQELIARFRETALNLREVETDRTKLQQQLAANTAAYDRCVERNYSLYQITGEVLDRYEHQGAFSYMAKAEPFTRLKRTQIENLVDEYRERAQELRAQKAGAKSGAASPPTAPATALPMPTNQRSAPSG